ncbi:MAG TPA: hypothetical protein VKM93_21205 [Terriglobia bacterium]|nr:hypothetical protein [Terriglobia bacterium]
MAVTVDGNGSYSKGEMIIDFTGPNPSFIDIKGHLGLGFKDRTHLATMLLKTDGLVHVKPSYY